MALAGLVTVKFHLDLLFFLNAIFPVLLMNEELHSLSVHKLTSVVC